VSFCVSVNPDPLLLTQIIASIALRKRSPLENHRWKTIPWIRLPKTSKDFLFDILGEISGLLEDFDRAKHCRDFSKKASLQRQLAEDCWKVDSRLVWWSETHGARRHINGLLARGFACLTTTDFAVAYVMSKYWTACIFAYSTLRLAVRPHLPSTMASLPERTDPEIYCNSIIDIVEIFLHPAAGAYGMQVLLFPLGIAYSYILSTEEGSASPAMLKILAYFEREGSGPIIRKLLGRTLRSVFAVAGEMEDDMELFKNKARAWFGMDQRKSLTTPANPHNGLKNCIELIQT
jgi:hypothetical protein